MGSCFDIRTFPGITVDETQLIRTQANHFAVALVQSVSVERAASCQAVVHAGERRASVQQRSGIGSQWVEEDVVDDPSGGPGKLEDGKKQLRLAFLLFFYVLPSRKEYLQVVAYQREAYGLRDDHVCGLDRTNA